MFCFGIGKNKNNTIGLSYVVIMQNKTCNKLHRKEIKTGYPLFYKFPKYK